MSKPIEQELARSISAAGEKGKGAPDPSRRKKEMARRRTQSTEWDEMPGCGGRHLPFIATLFSPGHSSPVTRHPTLPRWPGAHPSLIPGHQRPQAQLSTGQGAHAACKRTCQSAQKGGLPAACAPRRRHVREGGNRSGTGLAVARRRGSSGERNEWAPFRRGSS